MFEKGSAAAEVLAGGCAAQRLTSQAVLTVVMKNWDPLVSAPAAGMADSAPLGRTHGCSKQGLSCSYHIGGAPPVGYRRLGAAPAAFRC